MELYICWHFPLKTSCFNDEYPFYWLVMLLLHPNATKIEDTLLIMVLKMYFTAMPWNKYFLFQKELFSQRFFKEQSLSPFL